jgi:membrane carboxypeptidase/penicillin-binding protein
VMNDILKDVFIYGTAGKARSLGFERPFAGKTGTTSNYRDAWFIGYSPRILTLVWIGFDDGRSLRLAGGDACVPIWTAHMNRIGGLIPDVDWKRPDDVVVREIDPLSGLLATPFCPSTRREVFVSGTEPAAVCPLHAGGGELNPFFHDSELPPDLRGEGPATGEEPQKAEERRQREKRESGIRRLLRAIFGGGQ